MNASAPPAEHGRPDEPSTVRLTARAGPPAPARRSSATRPRQIDSHSLLQGQSVLLIEHQGELYRLQTTRQGKLILTK